MAMERRGDIEWIPFKEEEDEDEEEELRKGIGENPILRESRV